MSPDRVTWVGHATVLLELGGARLLTDPLLRTTLGHLRRHGAPPDPGVTEDLDAVLVSHLHLDHLDVPSLRRIDRRTPVLVPRGAGSLLRRKGFARTEELAPGEMAGVGGIEVRAVPADHDERRRPGPGGARADAVGFVVAGVYFAGDTDIYPEMASLGADRLALLPVWGWGPSLGSGHLDPEGAARAAALIRPRLAVPIHWGTFFPRWLERLRGDRLEAPPREFAAAVARHAPGVRVAVLPPGGSLPLPH